VPVGTKLARVVALAAQPGAKTQRGTPRDGLQVRNLRSAARPFTSRPANSPDLAPFEPARMQDSHPICDLAFALSIDFYRAVDSTSGDIDLWGTLAKHARNGVTGGLLDLAEMAPLRKLSA
jgi:hypothetical protein